MSGNAGRIARGVVKDLSPKLSQKATGIVNDAIEKQQAEVNEPLAQVPAQTLRAMIPINQGKNKSNQVQQDTQSEQNQIQFSSVNDILREINKKTLNDEENTIFDPSQQDDIVGLFNQAIEKAQNSKDFEQIITTLFNYTRNVIQYCSECKFSTDVCAKQKTLRAKFRNNEIFRTLCHNDAQLKNTFLSYLKLLCLLPKQQDTQSEQNQIQFSSVNDILREIKKKTFYEDDFIMDIDQFDNIVGLFNQAIEKTQNSKDLTKIISKLDEMRNKLRDKSTVAGFEKNDIWAKEAALCDKLYNKIVDANYSNDGKLIYTFCCFLDNLNSNILPVRGVESISINILDDVKEMKSNDKAKLLLTQTKIAYLALRIRPCFNFRTNFENKAILNIWPKLDDLSKIPDVNASGLIEEWFGKGETIDSVKEKAFISLGAAKPPNFERVDDLLTLFDTNILKNYLKTQTEDKQKELLSCFYPPGDGEQEKQIRKGLDTMLESIELPTPDLNGKHYDEQRLIWVSDEVAPAQTEEQALVQQQAQVANTTQKAHAEKPFRLTKELANDIYELYSNDGSIFNLETLLEDNRILEQQLEDKDKLSTKISHLKTYSNDLWRKIYTEDPVINSAIQRVYFLLVDLENRKTIEEKKQIFEQNKERFASLGFSSLENFYATMHGEKEPE